MNEYLAQTKIPKNTYFAVRLDADNFSKLSEEERLKKPFDSKVFEWFDGAIRKIFNSRKFHPIFAHHHSDEVSFLFDKDDDIFDRRVEKIITELCSEFTSHITLVRKKPIVFDAKLIVLSGKNDIKKYFKQREDDAFRSSINGYTFWKTVQTGISRKKSTELIKNMKAKERREYLFQKFGIGVDNLPAHQKQGYNYYVEEYKKRGYNPIRGEYVNTVRKRVVRTTKNVLAIL